MLSFLSLGGCVVVRFLLIRCVVVVLLWCVLSSTPHLLEKTFSNFVEISIVFLFKSDRSGEGEEPTVALYARVVSSAASGSRQHGVGGPLQMGTRWPQSFLIC